MKNKEFYTMIELQEILGFSYKTIINYIDSLKIDILLVQLSLKNPNRYIKCIDTEGFIKLQKFCKNYKLKSGVSHTIMNISQNKVINKIKNSPDFNFFSQRIGV